MRFVDICCLVVYLASVKVGCIDLSSSCNMARYLAVFGGGFVPTCRPDGSYEEVQCYDESCWCVGLDGHERKNTRVVSPIKPDCEYAAFAATEVDIIRVIAEEKGEEIKLLPDAFMSKPAYNFPPSTSINTKLKKYFPPVLWPQFSILVTANPEDLTGGFIFAIMDALESVVQFGVSLSQGENDYTQTIVLWYTEDMQMGSTKLTEFIVPAMVGRWSKFSIAVSGDEIHLYMYCHNYTMTSVERMSEELKFAEESLLLVGHAGNVLLQQFKGQIQEILITNNADDAAKQCDESFQRERQESAMVDEYNVQLGYSGDLDTEEEDVGFSGDTEHAAQPTIIPLGGDNSNSMYSTLLPLPGDLASSTLAVVNDGYLDDPRDKSSAVDGDMLQYEPSTTAVKGEKGDTGEPGLPGAHGINGIPGQMGEIGPRGQAGAKGEKGDSGLGHPSEKGAPGTDGRDGAKGERGEPGTSVVGPQGPPGASFIDQMRKIDSLEDKTLLSKLEKLKSFIGQKGEPGVCKNISGRPGADGRDGPIGMPGFPGERGKPGLQGERGYPGLPGLPGEPALKGETGDTGETGAKGEQGHRGPQGTQGAPGEPGKLITSGGEDVILLPGPQGKQGLDGERGHKGDSGQRGVSGNPGPRGPQGAMGMPGPPGLPGLEGLPGFDGLPGPQGRRGKSGNDGKKGEKGEAGVGLPGPPGPPGKSQGKPFFGAEWFDEDADQELSTIKGERGAKGDQGSAGTPGTVSYEALEQLIPLFITKGEKGEAGVTGTSGGCDNCKGMKGSQGEQGFHGKKGSPGAKGNFGMPGFPGIEGIPGKPGSPGPSIRGPKGEPGACLSHQCSNAGQKGQAGLDGLPGLPGLSGVKGTKGDVGETGDIGPPGPPGIATNADEMMPIPGLPGPPGPPGATIVGLQGPPGSPGAPGLPGRDGSSLGGGLGQGSYSHGYTKSESGVLLFTNEDDMSRASLAIPIGTLGYVSSQQRLYLRVPLGWQAVQMGHVVPLQESEIANIIPMWMDAPAPEEPPVHQSRDNSPALKLFALNEPMSGNLGGIAGADGHCYRHATKSGMNGEFRAILTSRLQDIESIVFSKYRHLAVINGKGEYLLKSWNSISDGKSDLMRNAPIYTFDGANINTDNRWHRKYLWHGAQRTGRVAVNEYCQAWTSDDNKELGATSLFTQGQLLDQSAHTCDTPLAVLCIQIHA